MNEINPEINDTVSKINKTWGGDFKIEMIDDWKKIIRKRKNMGTKIVHLTMYGQNINDIQTKLQNEDKLLVVVGAEKVPRTIYDTADYNVAIGSQPHSEISALGILLDRIQQGRQFDLKFNENKKWMAISAITGKNINKLEKLIDEYFQNNILENKNDVRTKAYGN